MGELVLLPIFFSLLIFSGCFSFAASQNKGLQFVGMSLGTGVVLFIGTAALLMACRDLLWHCSLFGNLFAGPFGGLVFMFFFIQVLPGLASIFGLVLVVLGDSARCQIPNPYGS